MTRGDMHAGKIATESGGTRPSGMHSGLKINLERRYMERTSYENENENNPNLVQFSRIFDFLRDFYFLNFVLSTRIVKDYGKLSKIRHALFANC